jgi:hypothetical protein
MFATRMGQESIAFRKAVVTLRGVRFAPQRRIVEHENFQRP